MLKHASPQRSSSSLSQPLPSSPGAARPPEPRTNTHVETLPPSGARLALRDSYSERSVDCDSLIVPASYAQAEKQAGYQVGTWTGVSQANVRRGLSFSSRRAPDALSFRSVRSEGPPASLTPTSPAKVPQASTSMTNVSILRSDGSSPKTDKPRKEVGFQYLKGDMSSLKNLLRLPGVRGHAKIIEVSKDGVVLSPDSLSLNSSDSFFTANSGRTSSRSWSSNASSNSNTTNTSTESNSSTSEPASTTIRVFAKCLRSDIEYKTISVSARASCREVVALLLSKYRMRHRDPNLFYLTMEVTVRRWSGAPVRSLLVLEDGARPAQLALCRPPGDSRFALQMRRGGVIKVHDTVLMPGSQYKSLLVSDRTTAEEVVQLLLNCYNRRDNKYYYAIHEVRRSPEYSDRMILPEEKPLEVKAQWPRDREAEFVFVLRRNMSQALSLRRLSLRTSDGKKPPSGVAVKETNKPVTQTELVPAHRTSAPAPRTPDDRVQILIVEEAVIDCTDVTPKMTTINRTTTAGCKGALEVFAGKTSTSATLPPGKTPTSATLPPGKTSTSATLPPGKTPTSATLPPLPITKPATEPVMTSGVAFSTRDSSTNTETKTWSNTSTQTVVSRKVVPRSASVPREGEAPSSQRGDTASVEPNTTVTKSASLELRVEPTKTNPHSHQGSEVRQLSCSAGPALTTASASTADVRHTCQHNCQHCFYI